MVFGIFNIKVAGWETLRVELMFHTQEYTRYRVSVQGKFIILDYYKSRENQQWELSDQSEGINLDKLMKSNFQLITEEIEKNEYPSKFRKK